MIRCRPLTRSACRQVAPFAAERIALISCYLAAVAIMGGFKWHYSTATAEALRWILQPVAFLVQWLQGDTYIWEGGIGFVRLDRGITIAPACAGLNFMLMVFGLTVAAFLHRRRSTLLRIAWLAEALIAAYVVAVGVNAVRIAIAVALFDAGTGFGWLSPERLHRVAGIAVYFSVLGLYYHSLDRILSGKNLPRPGAPGLLGRLPWIWYVAGTVAVPLLNQVWHGRPLRGAEHYLTVIVVSAVLGAGGEAVRRRIGNRHPGITNRDSRNRYATPHPDHRR